MSFLVGYRKTFKSFDEARTYAAQFQFVGHEHPDNIAHHSGQAERLRESDYPVLFHLAPLAGDLRKVFDLGGSVGNLFYSLQKELRFPDDLVWEVYDLPMMHTEGERLAAKKQEPRIRFTDAFSAASGCELFVTSGSLHYFERPLAEMLASLEHLPERIVINRTPCTTDTAANAEDLVTVQDNGSYIVPSKIHNPMKLVESLRKIGYTLRASWPVYERHLWMPLHPELSSTHYRGFYFVRTDVQNRAFTLPLAARNKVETAG